MSHDSRRRAALQAKQKRRQRLAAKAKPTIQAKAKTPAIGGKLSFACPVQIRAKDDANPNAQRTFSIIAYTGEPMNIWPFDAPVVIDLDTYQPSEQRIPALYDHVADADFIVGQVESLVVTAGKLVANGAFVVTDQPEKNWAKKVLDRADKGYQWQASVGANAATLTKMDAGVKFVANNGREYTGPAYLARGPEFREISFVVLGGDRRTMAVVARSAKIKGAAMSFEEWLLTLGFTDPAALDPVQSANLQMVYADQCPEEVEVANNPNSAPATPAGTPPTAAAAKPPIVQARTRPLVAGTAPVQTDIAAQMREQASAELTRQSEIRRICATYRNPNFEVTVNGQKKTVTLEAHAIKEDWNVTQTELEALRQDRGAGPAVVSRSHDRDCTVEALQGALLLRSNVRLDNPAFQSRAAVALKLPEWMRANVNAETRQRAMEAAHRFSSMSLTDMCRECLRISGRNAPHARDEMIQAAFSTGGTLADVFTTNMNAVLIASYLEAMDTTVGWVSEADVNDFKTQERTRIQMGEGLNKLPRGSEADHTSFADTMESYRIARFARQFVIDEQDVIDENLSVFGDTGPRFGRAAARLRPDLVYAILLSNPTLVATTRALFNATDGNTTTTAALAAATLRTAIAKMRRRQENSVNLNLAPTHLIVPPSLDDLSVELTGSAQITIGGTSAERGTVNTITRHGIACVSDARLENGVVNPVDGTSQSGSASTWFLLSRYAPTIEVGYLTGSGRAPRVRTFVLDRGKYGQGWDVSMDIGAKALDWRGMEKVTA